jgi:glycosyltransferase involved in cell wall biosynthesis
MRFSLVLATISRVNEVERFLESLNSQTHREFELIVVDQNRDDRLLPVLAAYREKFPLLHLRSEAGLSRSRNAGLPYIIGEVVSFPDDDCWYAPELLERIARFFFDHPELDGFTGRVVDEHGRSGTARFDQESGLLNQANVWQRAASVTLFLRRGVIEAIGGFDQALGVGAGTAWDGGEDIDYALRAVEAGFKVYYRPDISVLHPSLAVYDYSKLVARAYGYGAGIGRVWKKHDYPLWLVTYYLLRPIGGAILSLMQGNKSKAYYHLGAFWGRLRGWLSNS